MQVPLILERKCPAAAEIQHKVYKAAEIIFPLSDVEIHSFVSFHQYPSGEWEPCGETLALQRIRPGYDPDPRGKTGNGKSPK